MEASAVAKFNLLEEPWIPVLRGGQVEEVGLEEALLRAPEIARIETPSPLEEAALYRLLLAILHRALGGPSRVEEAVEWWEAGRFPEKPLRRYLDTYRERFYLFHDRAPFFQVADLPEKDPLPWSKLLPELASGNNPTLFDHTTEDNLPKASYAQAARALLVHQTFTPGGLLKRHGVTSAKGAPLAGAAAFLPTGKSLFETLLFNLVPYQKEGDAPLWELPPLHLKDLEGYKTKWPLSGTTRVYTWPSRGVRLLDEGDGVRFMAYGPGVEPLEAAFRDPMVAYRQDAKGNLLPLRFSMENAFWRDFGAMLPQAGGAAPATVETADSLLLQLDGHGPSPRLRVLGQVADQAKILDIRREVYPLPPGIFSQKAKPEKAELNLGQALKRAEEVGQGLKRLAGEVLGEVLGGGDRGELSTFAASLPLERLYWHALDGSFPAFLERLGQEGDRAWWEGALKGAAREAWAATRISLGTEARHLKALAKGEARLLALLAPKEERR